MKPMLLADANEIPVGEDWLYEAKFDGFRCIVEWTEEGVQLWSRNNKLLNEQFPEILTFCKSVHPVVAPYTPLRFDGEIVHLTNQFVSDFSKVQTRGRMKNGNSIHKHAQSFPCQLLLFDILIIKGKDVMTSDYVVRKQMLIDFFKRTKLPNSSEKQHLNPIQLVNSYKDGQKLWKLICDHNGEGIVAKKKNGAWIPGKRVPYWQKVKNWRTVSVFIRTYDPVNGYFTGAVFKGDEIVEIVSFRHGLTEDEMRTLRTLFLTKGAQTKDQKWELPPSICVSVHCIGIFGQQLREPRFAAFTLHHEPILCTWRSMMRQLYPIPQKVLITHSDKPIWPNRGLVKDDYLLYLQTVAPYILPWLQDRLLTAIRYPHGVGSESFYQKNRPDYAPDFIATHKEEGIEYIVCNDVNTLLWLGNQLALEFHIPFQTVKTKYPTEIVFDLDPPSVTEFTLAVEGALRLKDIFDKFQLRSYIKTSGGKGLQLYIPLFGERCSYEDTRVFTQFACEFLCEQEPKWFTTERLKKNRGGKLYLDYIQHQEGKTIVAPYSPRGTLNATVATPLEWEELNNTLHPEQFTIESVPTRLEQKGDLFRECSINKKPQNLAPIVDRLKELKRFR
ncbi:DNA ligase D [Sporosarcina sp. ITBMC105]